MFSFRQLMGILGVISLAIIACSPNRVDCSQSSNQQQSTNKDDKNKPEPLDPNFDLFPQVIDCNKEHEMPAPGKLAECEPTCSNPRPACLKIFHVGLDFVPCFCKAPLVRHPKSKEYSYGDRTSIG